MKKSKIAFLYSNGLFLERMLEKFETDFDVTAVEINKKTRKLPIPFSLYIPWKIRPYLRKNTAFIEWTSDILIHTSKKKRKAKIITRCHRADYFEHANKIKWGNVDRVIFVCEAMRKRFVKDYPKLKEKSTVIYNAIKLENYEGVERKKTFDKKIAVMGNLIERKRVYDLIFAFQKLLEKDEGYSLHIAGKGSDYQIKMLQELVKKLNLENKVTIYGFVDNKIKWLNSMDIIVSNSIHESFHYTLHEGALCGCYPLSHFWDGVEEFLPLENIYSSQDDFVTKVIEVSNMKKEKRLSKLEKIQERIIREHAFDKIYNDLKKVINES